MWIVFVINVSVSSTVRVYVCMQNVTHAAYDNNVTYATYVTYVQYVTHAILYILRVWNI